MPLKSKFKLGKAYKILFAILTPLAIISLISSIYAFNYLKNKEDTVFNLAEINMDSLDMGADFYHYYKLGYKTIIGVDLSEHNKDVDFIKLKDQGVKFAILRIGWRGYADPILHLDNRFEEYYEKAKEVGIKIGVYFFSQAINEKEAIEEAQFVLENLKDKPIDMYIAYDCESIDNDIARTDDLTKKQATLDAFAFLNTVADAGYSPILYTNYSWIKNYYETDLLVSYPVWYAQYSRNPQYKGNHIIWQYASSMVLDGVSGEDGVDLNLMIIKEDIN